ncbi:MAG: hypothetical protein WBK88_08440, partial [Methanothrix sp.]
MIIYRLNLCPGLFDDLCLIEGVWPDIIRLAPGTKEVRTEATRYKKEEKRKKGERLQPKRAPRPS